MERTYLNLHVPGNLHLHPFYKQPSGPDSSHWIGKGRGPMMHLEHQSFLPGVGDTCWAVRMKSLLSHPTSSAATRDIVIL